MSNVTISDVNSAIISGQFTNEQLASIVDAIKYARAQLGKQNIRSIVLGSRVQWNSTRNGRIVTGTVKKIGRKFVTVDGGAGVGMWRVPGSMLQVA